MGFGSMGWWYWFGMQIFGISSIVLTWWLFLDAFRRKGTPSRFIWPIIAAAGLLMQLPAFAVAQDAQATGVGTAAALVGVIGLIAVSLSAITYFYRTPSGSGSGWSLRTRDENSTSRSVSDRRRLQVPQASVPVAPVDARRSGRTAPAVIPGLRADKNTPSAAGAPSVVPSAPVGAPAPVTPPDASSQRTVVADDEPLASAEPLPTITDEPAPTITDDEQVSATVCDEVPATIVDEPGTVSDEPDETPPGSDLMATPRLAITDGRSSQIIITERSGPFIVGRDPSKCSLAVDDSRASRAHFSITADDGSYHIQDLGSSNGTFVNGALVKDNQRLNDGDTVEFGRTIATFEMAQS